MRKSFLYNIRGRRTSRSRSVARLLAGVLVLGIVAELGVMALELRARHRTPPEAPAVEVVEARSSLLDLTPAVPELAKKDLAGLLGPRDLVPDDTRIIEVVDQNGRPLYVRTTIIPDLQIQADGWVKASRAHQAAVVALEPDSGEVLALAGYRDDGRERNAALDGCFPAASLFKIVTAAAAVEKAELSADSKLAYDGGKHTLYKGNVVKEPEQGRQATTLKDSFADSINSVFGKLGASTLGPEELADFANRFGFNQDIDFEMPVEASSFNVDGDDTFHLAELASGYNRSTRVSPLHGALMAAAVAAGGRVPEPSFVREVFDRDNHIYYQSNASGEPREVISPRAAEELSRMMRAAVEDGTGRRTFHDAGGDPVLSRLDIGGKSGTINNDAGQRVDWFVAWAKPRPGSGCRDTLAVSAVVVHSGQTTTTSQRLVRNALVAYYKDRLTGRHGTARAEITAPRPNLKPRSES